MLSLKKTKELLKELLCFDIVRKEDNPKILDKISIQDVENKLSIKYPKYLFDIFTERIDKIVNGENKDIPISKIIDKRIVDWNFEKEKKEMFAEASNDFIVNSSKYGKESANKMLKIEKERDKKINKNKNKIDKNKEEIKLLEKKKKEIKRMRKETRK